jgi:hypothetical protein
MGLADGRRALTFRARSCFRGPFGRGLARARRPATGRPLRVAGQCLRRGGRPGLAFECRLCRLRPCRRGALALAARSALRARLGSVTCAARWWWQLHACPPGLGQPDGDRLFGRTSAVLAFTDVFDLLLYKCSRLRRGCLALALGPSGSLQCLLFRHGRLRWLRSKCQAVRPVGAPGKRRSTRNQRSAGLRAL